MSSCCAAMRGLSDALVLIVLLFINFLLSQPESASPVKSAYTKIDFDCGLELTN